MRTFISVGLILAGGLTLRAAEPTPIKVSVCVSRVSSDEVATVLRDALSKVEGVKVKPSDLVANVDKDNFGNDFSPPFTIELTNPAKADLGIVAKAIAETKVKRGELGPWLCVVLFPPGFAIEELDVSRLREAVAETPGVDARSTGGTGAKFGDSRFWVRLDGSGAARVEEILAAVKRASVDVRLARP